MRLGNSRDKAEPGEPLGCDLLAGRALIASKRQAAVHPDQEIGKKRIQLNRTWNDGRQNLLGTDQGWNSSADHPCLDRLRFVAQPRPRHPGAAARYPADRGAAVAAAATAAGPADPRAQ